MLVWAQDGSKCILVYPRDRVAGGRLRLAVLPSITREYVVPHIASLGRDQNSKFQVWSLNAFRFGVIVKTKIMKVRLS